MFAASSAAASLTSAGVHSGVTASSGVPSAMGKLNGTSGGTAPFADLMTDAVQEVNQLEDQAQAAVHGLMTGSGVDVHQAMISTEKASMAFELSLAIRNKAVQAYQQVMGMPF